LSTETVSTRPFPDQKPGTAGLRKKVVVFQQPGYLENFLQSIVDAAGNYRGATLVAGGDGRYFNDQAIQTLARIAAGNGVERLIIGRGGLLSTPAASHLIRTRRAAGGLLLTASHNPGGPDGDFGIKVNTASGGQASESMMEAVYRHTRSISRYLTAAVGPVDLDRTGESRYGPLTVEIVDPVAEYAALMERLFDFDGIRSLFAGGFTARYDAMHAVTGPYASEILHRRLGLPADWILNAVPLPDFGGGHPDPNPVDAADLMSVMTGDDPPRFGAASDGDGDRNMILGPGMVVSPGDSLAVMTAMATEIPGYRKGLAGVARSMPTSRAVDRVAAVLDIPCYETPTGWRFFCNLLDAGRIDLCGEESFGTSSSHVREKDGLWAVLFWLNLIAVTGKSVPEIIQAHWRRFGRNAFNREDYFIADAGIGDDLLARLEASVSTMIGTRYDGRPIRQADIFEYEDPVDGSVSGHQGVRVVFEDDSRIVFRLSGTGTAGATLRIYLERRIGDGPLLCRPAVELNAPLSQAARSIASVEDLTGLSSPTAVV
jgi:phosphoglucomutase